MADEFDVEPEGTRIFTDNGVLWPDIILPALRVVIEYDGEYWHRNKAQRDNAKTLALEAVGWTVIRVRCRPLPLLSASDISVNEGDTAAAAQQLVPLLRALSRDARLSA